MANLLALMAAFDVDATEAIRTIYDTMSSLCAQVKSKKYYLDNLGLLHRPGFVEMCRCTTTDLNRTY